MFKSRVFRSVLVVLFVLAVNQPGTTGADENELLKDLPSPGRTLRDVLNLSPGLGFSTGTDESGNIFALQITEQVGASADTNLLAFSFSTDENGRLVGDPTPIPVDFDVDLFTLGQYLHRQNPDDTNSPFITSALTANFDLGILTVGSSVDLSIVQSGQFLSSSFTETENYFFVDAYDGSGSFNFKSWIAPKGGGLLSWNALDAPTEGNQLHPVYGSYAPIAQAIPGTDTVVRVSAAQFSTANDQLLATAITLPGGSIKTIPLDFVPLAHTYDTPKETCLTPAGTGRDLQLFTSVGGVLKGFQFNTEDGGVRIANIGIMGDSSPGFVNGIGCAPFGSRDSVVAWEHQIKLIDQNGDPVRSWTVPGHPRGAYNLVRRAKLKKILEGLFNEPGGSTPAATTPGTYLVTLDPRQAQSLPQLVLPATDVVLSNHGSEEALVDFRVISQAGDFLETQEVQLQPFGSRRISLAGSTTTLTPSWGWIASFNNGISATATYTFDVGGGAIPKIGVSASTLSRRWGLTGVVNPAINTGLAVSNPANDAIQCTLNLFPSDGTLQGTASFELAARGQISQFLTQFNFDTGNLSVFDGSFTVECSDDAGVLAITQEATTGFLVSIPGTPLE